MYCFDANLVSDDEQSQTLDTKDKGCETPSANEIPPLLIHTLTRIYQKELVPM